MQITAQTNVAEVLGLLTELEKKGQNLAPVFDEIANAMYSIADAAFEDEASPDGSAWQPLSALTIERKGHDRKLHDSGHLRETLDFDSDNRSATVGTNAVSEKGYPYPAVHQFGTDDGKVSARPFLPFTDEGDLMDGAAHSILALVHEYFETD